MSQKPINLSPDLQRLRKEGYDIEIRSDHLLVKGVPYLNAKKEILEGTLVSALSLAGDVAVPPQDHTVMFVGEYPCRPDGSPIEAIRNSSERKTLANGLVTDFRFSNKSTAGPDKNYYDKMTRYIEIISSQARALDPSRTAQTSRRVKSLDKSPPFVYTDSASSRAGITAASQKLELARVAIIGLGGTGSYVLDLVAKTPVSQIHIFDGDELLQHNAFRSPGAASSEELRARPLKVDYFALKYSKMHQGIVAHGYYVAAENASELSDMDFVFLCLDRGSEKEDIVTTLLQAAVSFIDVGMGVTVDDESGEVGGIVRVTAATADKHGHVATRIPYSDADPSDDYSTNIQIADLSALSAALAVIKWKKLCGFFGDRTREHHTTFSIDSNVLTNEECP